MKDLIDRKAVIKIINDELEYSDNIYATSVCITIRRAVNDLPSAQSETNCSEFPNNSDAISRQDAIDALHMHLMYRMGTDSNKKRLDDWINGVPSALTERKKGTWILVRGSNGKDYHKCSECLHTQDITGVKNYCAVCGVDMRGEEHE